MKRPATYIYSQLSAESAGQLSAAYYDSIKIRHCRFYVLGLHDNYLIETDNGVYILRIYRNDWRNSEEIHFELELLAHLKMNNAPVAYSIPTKNGELSFQIDSPEGIRHAALFHYADGHAPDSNLTCEQSRLLGQAVSTIHNSSDTFSTKQQRPELDIHYLVDESIESIRSFLDSETASYIDKLHTRLGKEWPTLPRQPGEFGICIGDVNQRNFHITSDHTITLFDFDQCGYGYRAFEMGKFASSLRNQQNKRELMNAFLEGYQAHRQPSRAEYQAISYFEQVAVLWVMSIHARNANRIGYKFLERHFWERKIQHLKELEIETDTSPGYGNC